MAEEDYKGFKISVKPKKSSPISFEGSYIKFIFYVRSINRETKEGITIPYKLSTPSKREYNGIIETSKPELDKTFVVATQQYLLDCPGYYYLAIPLNGTAIRLYDFNVYSKSIFYVTLIGAFLGSFLAYLLIRAILP